MAATIVDLVIEQGSPFTKVFRAKNSDNSDKDLTGYLARMQIRETYSSSAVALDLTTENAKLSIDAQHSLVTIQISHDDTALLDSKRYVYDLELIDSSAVPFRFIMGAIQVSPEVTRN